MSDDLGELIGTELELVAVQLTLDGAAGGAIFVTAAGELLELRATNGELVLSRGIELVE